MSDSDLQQFTPTGADAETANGQNPLSAEFLLPVDGKKITADANTALKAPVNRALKKARQFIAGLRGATLGDVTGVNRRTFKSLEIDGTGGLVSSLLAGLCKAVAFKASQYFEVDSGSAVHSVFPSNGVVSVTGGGTFTYDDESIYWEDTAASAANPASTVALRNELRPLLLTKAWAVISFNGSGGIAADDGANCASVSIVGSKVRMTFAQGLDTAVYGLQVTGVIGSVVIFGGAPLTDRKAGYVDITLQGHNPASEAGTIDVTIVGRMTS